MSRQASVRTSDRVVFQVGTSIGERDGCVNENITDDQFAAIMDAPAPNGGIVLDPDGTVRYLPPLAPTE